MSPYRHGWIQRSTNCAFSHASLLQAFERLKLYPTEPRDARRLCISSARYSDFSQFIISLELGFAMGWMSRYGKWQDDFARPVPGVVKFHHVIAVMFFLTLLAGCIACFPLTLIFVSKPQLTEYMPKEVHCATCEEVWQHNPDLFNREDMLCYGPSTYVRYHASEHPYTRLTKAGNSD